MRTRKSERERAKKDYRTMLEIERRGFQVGRRLAIFGGDSRELMT
jgi:hypothetical protein